MKQPFEYINIATTTHNDRMWSELVGAGLSDKHRQHAANLMAHGWILTRDYKANTFVISLGEHAYTIDNDLRPGTPTAVPNICESCIHATYWTNVKGSIVYVCAKRTGIFVGATDTCPLNELKT